jgi:hypothetical protein
MQTSQSVETDPKEPPTYPFILIKNVKEHEPTPDRNPSGAPNFLSASQSRLLNSVGPDPSGFIRVAASLPSNRGVGF